MRSLKFILVGIVFGIVMSKSEAVSWYRIQEMFRFQAFHMYGIIGTAVAIGIIAVYLIKKYNVRDNAGHLVAFHNKAPGRTKYIAGGIIFGLGWALTGACPGPMFVLVGHGLISLLIVIIGALAGTFMYGVVKSKLPH
ncbi:MAG: YeeE/YedE family protein [Sphingobacteriaceae bacterium]|nr:MAG: YeeE/YedE family protein [Sphingobacteriaceae bacterium]